MKESMEEQILTRSVSISVSNMEGTEEREYTVSCSNRENGNKEQELWVVANGMDINLPLKDAPLLVQALKEFC